MKSFIEIQPHGRPGFIAVRFSAWGAYLFFGLPMIKVANGETGLQDGWNELCREIEERIFSAQTSNHRIKTIRQYLLVQLSKNAKLGNAVNFCLTEIASSGGRISIEDLSCKSESVPVSVGFLQLGNLNPVQPSFCRFLLFHKIVLP